MDDLRFVRPTAVDLFFAALVRTLREIEQSGPHQEGLSREILARLDHLLSPDELSLLFDDLPLRDLEGARKILGLLHQHSRSDS